jgi:hypothetical protein
MLKIAPSVLSGSDPDWRRRVRAEPGEILGT